MTGEAKERGSLWAQYCCECNICSLIACPEQLDPKNICVDAKALLREKKLGRREAELEQLFRPPHPARHGREIPIATLYQRLGLDAIRPQGAVRRSAIGNRRRSRFRSEHAHRATGPSRWCRQGDMVERGSRDRRRPTRQTGVPRSRQHLRDA